MPDSDKKKERRYNAPLGERVAKLEVKVNALLWINSVCLTAIVTILLKSVFHI